MHPTPHDVLLVVDVQNDFCPGGALAVPEGDAIIPVIHRIAPLFQHVILTQDWHPEGRSYPGFNFFDSDDEAVFRAIAQGEFYISGMHDKTLRRLLSGKRSSRAHRLLKRLRLHGLIRKVARGSSTS